MPHLDRGQAGSSAALSAVSDPAAPALAPLRGAQVVSKCKPSLFAYPPPVTVEDRKSKDKVGPWVLFM